MSATKTLAKKENPVMDMEKLKALSKKELLKVMEESLLPFNSPEKYKERVRSLMPAFAKEVETIEDRGTAVFEAGEEYHMVVLDCLRRYHHFTEPQIKQLHREITDVLRGVKAFETEGLSMLSPHSVEIVGDNIEDLGIGGLLDKIAQVRIHKTNMGKAGLEWDKLPEKPFVKRLSKNK